jgi:hypothetical protein
MGYRGCDRIVIEAVSLTGDLAQIIDRVVVPHWIELSNAISNGLEFCHGIFCTHHCEISVID